jgi:transposase
MQRENSAVGWRRSTTTREEELAERVHEMLPLVGRLFTLEQLRYLLVKHFNFRIHISVIDEAIRSERLNLRGRP